MNGERRPPARRAAFAAPAPSPADVGIVAAMSIEVGFLLDRLTKVRKYAGPRHTVIEGECGGQARRGGRQRASGRERRAPRAPAAARRPPPPLGRLGRVRRRPEPRPGAQRHRAGRRGHRPRGASVRDRRRPSRPRRPDRSIRPGRLLTVDRIVRTAAEKAELRRRFEADLVDMETSAVAALCSERGVRFLVDPGHQRRGPGRPPPRDRHAPDPLGQLPRRRRLAGHLAPAVEPQGLLGAPRARPGGRRPARRVHRRRDRTAGLSHIEMLVDFGEALVLFVVVIAPWPCDSSRTKTNGLW